VDTEWAYAARPLESRELSTTSTVSGVVPGRLAAVVAPAGRVGASPTLTGGEPPAVAIDPAVEATATNTRRQTAAIAIFVPLLLRG
jgi:hypothetical protein